MQTAQVVIIEGRARRGLERSDPGAQDSDPTCREGISVMAQHQDYETKRAALRERFQTVSDSTDGQPAAGTGGVDHLALKASSEDFTSLLARLDEASIEYSVHGGGGAGSVYVRDPDGILVEVTTGY